MRVFLSFWTARVVLPSHLCVGAVFRLAGGLVLQAKRHEMEKRLEVAATWAQVRKIEAATAKLKLARLQSEKAQVCQTRGEWRKHVRVCVRTCVRACVRSFVRACVRSNCGGQHAREHQHTREHQQLSWCECFPVAPYTRQIPEHKAALVDIARCELRVKQLEQEVRPA